MAAQTAPKTIQIHADGTVSPDSVTIPINGEGVEWQGLSGSKWKVKFDNGGPFKGDDFDNDKASSGGPDPEKVKNIPPGQEKSFKYSVQVDGGKWIDPNIIVRNENP